MLNRSIPNIQIVPVRAQQSTPTDPPAISPATGTATELRSKRVDEFLQARSLAPKSQRALSTTVH